MQPQLFAYWITKNFKGRIKYLLLMEFYLIIGLLEGVKLL